MQEEWIIDGYNLLHWLKANHPQKSRFSRENLLQMLCSFASLEGSSVVVVLDGVGNESEFKAFESSRMRVFYSQSVSADAFIEKYLFQSPKKSSLIVVTQDTAISRVARGCGARVLKPELFFEQFTNTRSTADDVIWEKKAEQHGFNRPFDKKLKDNN